MRHFIPLLFIALALASVSVSAQAQRRYHLVALEPTYPVIPVGGAGANALSGNGFLAGASYFADSSDSGYAYTHALIWQNQTITLLENFGASPYGVSNAVATSINRLGQAVGYSTVYDARHNDEGVGAFLWSSGVFSRLPELGHDQNGKTNTRAVSINDTGDVVGSSDTYDSYFKDTGPVAFLYHNGVSTPLVDFGSNIFGYHSSYAASINNPGQICGNALAYDSNHNSTGSIAWVYANGTVTTLPSPGNNGAGQTSYDATAINDNGLIVGTAFLYNPITFTDVRTAVTWQNGVVTLLPNLDPDPTVSAYSVTTAVNRSGDIVGYSYKPNFLSLYYQYDYAPAVLWHNGAVYDLNQLLVASAPPSIVFATGISDGGRIYAFAVPGIAYGGDALLIPIAGGDFDNDGFTDLLWQNTTTGDIVIGFSDGNTYRGTASLASAVPVNWQIVATPDLNGDGHSDVLWRNTTNGGLAYWLTDGQTLIDSRLLASAVPLDWRVVGSGDFVGDGYTDILFQNQTTGDVAYWQMQGTAFVRSRILAAGIPLDWQIVGVADLNHDGSDDVLLRNTQTGDLAYWFLHGDTIVDAGLITPTISLDWQIKGVGDLTGDGTVGLLWQNVTTGDVYAWTLNGTALANTRFIASAIPAQWQLVGPK